MSTIFSGRNWRLRFRRQVLVAVVILVSLLAAFTTPHHELGWIDPVTGSMKRQTQWFGFSTSTMVDQSAIEKWIIRHEGRYSSHWAFLHDTSMTAWGRSVEFACAMAPDIYALHAGELNDEFVRGASEPEINEFLQVMRTGSE